jgi:DNA-binding transcriptional LysR family regulator
MELRHFRYFVAVAETLHFGRAAARLRIAQPSVSQQIRQLETELQTKLFERTKRHVHLTEEGARFLEEAREVLAHADRAAMSVGRAFEGEGGILRIGLGYYMDETKITRALKLFAERHPAIHAEARHMSVVFQLATLRDELLDVGFVRPPVREALLASDVIISEPLCVALPRKHRFVARKWIELSELADESFILVERDVVPVFREFVP